MPRTPIGPKNSRFAVLASICVVVAALYFAQDVLIPVALAMLFSFLLAPIVNQLERWKLGRVMPVIIAVVLFFGLFGALGYVVATQIYDLADNVDKYKGNIVAKVEQFHPKSSLLDKLERTATEVQQHIGDGDKSATTQTSQPSDKAAATGATKPSAHASDADARPDPRSPTTNRAGAVPTTQWSKDNPLPVAMVDAKQSPMDLLGKYFGVVLGPLGTAGIVIVFVVFMLLQREDLRNRLIRLTAGNRLTVATQALDDASSRISRYLLAQAFVNGTYGIAIALGLWIIGLTLGRHDSAGTQSFPNVLLWGLLCAVLRFIPYIGPWIAAAFPMLISLAVYKSMGPFMATVGLFVVIELVSNNFMEPWLYGSSTGMSAVAVLVSAVFWTWLWGAVGLLLATPLTVVLVVLGKYVPALQFLDVLLGDEQVLDPPTRLYQRLLALDGEEATDLLEEYRKTMPLEEVYDKVLLPALGMSEQDRTRGLLDERRQTFIRRSMRDMIEEMGDQERLRIDRAAVKQQKQDDKHAKDTANGKAVITSTAPVSVMTSRLPNISSDCVINIVCLPAHDEADEICNLMLVQLLELRGYCAYSASAASLASEMIDEIEKRDADVIVVSALPPGAVAHARYLCKRIHQRFPEAKMSVGLWNYSGDLTRAKERMTCVASVQLVNRLADMQDQIDQLAQHAMVKDQAPTRVEPAAPTG